MYKANFRFRFFQCKVLAAKIVDESSIISAMIHLLSSAPNALQHEQKDQKTSTVTTPKWMTPLLLFIDLYEKVILGMFTKILLCLLTISVLCISMAVFEWFFPNLSQLKSHMTRYNLNLNSFFTIFSKTANSYV